jgi:tetratricopeptide (TPR) repeat protein
VKNLLMVLFILLALAGTGAGLAWSQREPLSRVYNNARRSQAAYQQLHHFDRIVRAHQEDGEAWYNRGIAHVESGDDAMALKDFQVALRLEPEDLDALYNLAWVQIRLGQNQEALKSLNNLLQRRPGHTDARWNRAWLHERMKKPALAKLDYQLIQRKPGSLPLADQARLAQNLGQYARARDLFSQMLKKQPQDAQALLGRARSLRALEEPEAALADLEKLLKKQANAEAYQLKGDLLVEQEEPESALADYTRALELKPSASLYRARATLLQEQKKPAEALADLQQALALEATNVPLLLEVARLEAGAGQTQAALEHLQKAFKLKPKLGKEAVSGREFARLKTMPEFKALVDEPEKKGKKKKKKKAA